MTAYRFGAGPLLLDFDGPVCSVFSGYPASRIAAELVGLLDQVRVAVPDRVRRERDPMAVLRWVGDHAERRVVVAVEDAFCAAELAAVGTAEPTPFGHQVILNAVRRGNAVGVVSNNSAVAVEAYLDVHGLTCHVSPVIGRAYADPARMKPNPEPILTAARILGVAPQECVLVGDSLSDIEAARAAGVGIIGYANRPWKVDAFRAADHTVTSMQTIAEALA
ncbi:HAD family hydrolase [Paractinoplanes durhamensis]|uniref:Hydrolase n=1 Tax=Paractinoplanes durhamensis TaxID=113563 RepID=A0ABQ3Z6M0_9ACTN|nr:HAD-IA family hydrolase [Actinoplanes durhamensis]GIE05421.1 hydrolase [Actinoplanes durhamensis]